MFHIREVIVISTRGSISGASTSHPEEVEEVCFGASLYCADGDRSYAVYGRTEAAGIIRSSCTREGRVSIAWQRHGR